MDRRGPGRELIMRAEAGVAGAPRALQLDPRSKPGLVYLILCILVLSAGLIAFRSSGWNANVMLLHELIFMASYVFLLRPPFDLSASVKGNPVAYSLGLPWALSITVSLIWSPLGMGHELLGILRYFQTLFHVMFFFVLRDFLARYPVPRHWILLVIPVSGLVVALVMGYQLLQLDSYDEAIAQQWFNNPPLNGHIRYTGYQIAAAIAATVAFFVFPARAPLGRKPLFLILVVLCTLLFWMGGRASILGVVVVFAALALMARIKGVGGRYLRLGLAGSMIIGLVLAQAMAVFPWNGLFSALSRTVEASDLVRVSSGRLTLWREAWDSVQPHLAFGLGPQGYFFMPNRSFGLQPHSMLVQFVVEWGLIGTLLFLGLLAYGFWRGIVAHVAMAGTDVNPAALSAGSVIVALTVLGLVDGTYYHPQPSLYLAIAFAIWTLPGRAETEASRLAGVAHDETRQRSRFPDARTF